MGPRAEQQNYINFYKLIRQTIIRNVNSIKATNILCIIWVNKNFYNNLIKKLMHNLFFFLVFFDNSESSKITKNQDPVWYLTIPSHCPRSFKLYIFEHFWGQENLDEQLGFTFL